MRQCKVYVHNITQAHMRTLLCTNPFSKEFVIYFINSLLLGDNYLKKIIVFG